MISDENIIEIDLVPSFVRLDLSVFSIGHKPAYKILFIISMKWRQYKGSQINALLNNQQWEHLKFVLKLKSSRCKLQAFTSHLIDLTMIPSQNRSNVKYNQQPAFVLYQPDFLSKSIETQYICRLVQFSLLLNELN